MKKTASSPSPKLSQATVARKEIPTLINTLCKKGARPVTVVVRSDVNLLKKDRETREVHEFGDSVTKVARYQAFLNFNYGHSVNLQREREGKPEDFKTKPVWFVHKEEDARPIVRDKHTDKPFLQLKLEKKLGDMYLLTDGSIIEHEKIVNLLPTKKHSKNQELEKEVITICPALDNLISLTCDGVEYGFNG